jgi:hypothetical protein
MKLAKEEKLYRHEIASEVLRHIPQLRRVEVKWLILRQSYFLVSAK